MMPDGILQEQIAYYRARAPEYDDSLKSVVRFDPIERALYSLGPFENALEIACGTGIWTKKLLRIARRLTALDAAPEMLAINEASVAEARVRYVCANVFEWAPDRDDLFFHLYGVKASGISKTPDA